MKAHQNTYGIFGILLSEVPDKKCPGVRKVRVKRLPYQLRKVAVVYVTSDGAQLSNVIDARRHENWVKSRAPEDQPGC